MSADQYVMANANRCTVHPQHVMVDRGYSLQHFGHVYRCDCGEWRLGNTDEDKVYPRAQRMIDRDARDRARSAK